VAISIEHGAEGGGEIGAGGVGGLGGDGGGGGEAGGEGGSGQVMHVTGQEVSWPYWVL
jgi:hypothetical protein